MLLTQFTLGHHHNNGVNIHVCFYFYLHGYTCMMYCAIGMSMFRCNFTPKMVGVARQTVCVCVCDVELSMRGQYISKQMMNDIQPCADQKGRHSAYFVLSGSLYKKSTISSVLYSIIFCIFMYENLQGSPDHC